MLNADVRAAYAEMGLLLVPALLTRSEAAAIAEEWSRLWKSVTPDGPNLQWRRHNDKECTPDRIDFACSISPLLRDIVTGPPLTCLAADILGAPAILFKEKLISKLPGTHGYGLHQDWPYWEPFGVPADEMVTLVIAIDPADAENGALELWPGVLSRLPPDPAEPLDADSAALPRPAGEIMRMAPGDCLAFHPLVPHRSGSNRSAVPRRAYFVTYVTETHRHAAETLAAGFHFNA